MKEIAIISTFYHSSKNAANYGATLQSYAMVKTIEKLGYTAEQIRYDVDSNRKISFRHKCKVFFKKTLKVLLKKKDCNVKVDEIKLRNDAFYRFEDQCIPYSRDIYDCSNIEKTIGGYKGYVIGSDQVWNPGCIDSVYLLEFVPNDCLKVAYAPSIGDEKLFADRANIYTKSLKRFNAVSVREKSASELLTGTGIKAEWVLDPTLLLDKEEWESIVEPVDKYGIEGEYLFCYWIDEDEKSREIATTFAKQFGLKIVTFPFMRGRYREIDKDFGDYRLFDVDPGEFLGLMKNAKYVFTDSFHASIFAWTFDKNFVAFQRSYGKEQGKMSTRLLSLFEILQCEERFISDITMCSMEHISNILGRKLTKKTDIYQKHYETSISFLKNALGSLSK